MGYNPSADIVRIAAAVEKAPSVFNTRPWSFRFSGTDRIELRLLASLGDLDRARAREYTISCGAALLNLRLAIRVAGHDLAVWLLPDPEHDSALLASVEIMTGRFKKPTVEDQELYEAIWQRHTNRSPYRIRPAPLPIIVAMEQEAAKEGGWLRLLHPRQARKWMRLAAEVDRDPAFRPPFPNRVSAANYGPPPKNRYPRTRRDFWRDSEEQRFERKPQLMALSTDDDKPLDWLRAGQALQRAILTGTRYSVSAPYGPAAQHHAPARYGIPARHHLLPGHDKPAYYGLSVSFLTQPLERDDVRAVPRHWPWRWRFSELPEMVVRVGYAADEPPPAQRQLPDIGDAWPQLPGQPSQHALPGPGLRVRNLDLSEWLETRRPD
jgi:hypothetical protein